MKKIISILLAFVIIFVLAIQSSADTLKNINGVTYRVGSNGVVGDKYTGWATLKSTGELFYYKNGLRVTGVNVIDGSRCVFDNKGIYMFKRTNANEPYSVIFNNNYNVSMKDEKISFDVKVNGLNGKNPWDFAGNPHFTLSVYKNGRWRAIKHSFEFYHDLALGMFDESKMTIGGFSLELSAFNFDFEPGLYRVRALVGNGDRDKDGKYIWTSVWGEFNLI
ncbi:MAG: hypothetical protein FWG44_04380 [Oscillospiraceae bacterium]|nr:hypothetical protein [Oscillospiraceae bacterium]